MDDTTEPAPFELSADDRRVLSLRRWNGPNAARVAKVYEASGLSVDAFAALAGADRRRLGRLIERAQRSADSDHGFAQVDVQGGGAAILVHAGGAAITVTSGFNASLLRAIVSALTC